VAEFSLRFPQFFLEDKEALMEGELLQVKVIIGN